MNVKKIITRSFSSDSLGFHEALSKKEGLAKLASIRPEIAMGDIRILGSGEFKACQEIRNINPKTAIILTSAYDTDEDKAIKAKEAGADAYLSKPIKRGEFLFIVEFIFRTVRLTETVLEKNRMLEGSLERVQNFHKKLISLSDELRIDKKRLNSNLEQMIDLNNQLDNKNIQISKMMKEISERFQLTVALLAKIVEMNRLDRDHPERVEEISVYIARKLKLNDYQVQNIVIAARLHELGIVGLPIYEKDKAATWDENKGIYNFHPLVGEMLLKSYPGFELVADIIRHLYENFNGTGMPDGLIGDSIPIGSRIVAVASYYDHKINMGPDKKSTKVFTDMKEGVNAIFDDRVLYYLKEFIENQQASPEGRVIECDLFNLAEGMELASDIFSESGINLLRKDTVINKETLSKILKFNNVDPIVDPIKIRQQ
tara:strand:- start:917 stop:2203 length:1287 start_codon:yes stop_codon:yes gene_type:complete